MRCDHERSKFEQNPVHVCNMYVHTRELDQTRRQVTVCLEKQDIPRPLMYKAAHFSKVQSCTSSKLTIQAAALLIALHQDDMFPAA